MAKDKLLILAIFLVIIGLAVGIRVLNFNDQGTAPAGSAASSPGNTGIGNTPPAQRPIESLKVDQFRGFTLQLQGSSPSQPYETFIDEIADAGANAICLSVAGYQENCASTSIFIDSRRAPSTERLKSLVARAHKRGMRVMLMPIVLLENPRSGEWRGKISPKNWDDWWEDYNNYILHYARIAKLAGVEVLAVGSELVSTEKDHANRWRSLIARVRKAYPGYLIYSANWDHYRPVSWWDAVDIVGMTTYYDLTGGKEATIPRLKKKWKQIRKEVLAWQKTIGRPIFFTEVGWPNQITCAECPWDYTRNRHKPDPKAQANCFEAFFDTWIEEPSVAGFLVWEWRNWAGQVVDPNKDTSYVPCGKPAMDIIKKYYRRPDPTTSGKLPARPATSRPATTPDGADQRF